MTPSSKLLLTSLLAAAGLAEIGLAQTQFLLRAQVGPTVQTIADQATVTFPSEGVGQSISGAVSFTYRGSTSATINSFELTGFSDFAASSSTPFPFTLGINETGSISVQFTPSAQGRFTGRLSISFTERTTSGSITVNLVGVLPDFGFSYQLLPRGNQTFIAPNGTIPFPDTAVDQISSATFVITNRGSGPGTVSNVIPAGGFFNLSGVPLLPVVVASERDLRFTVNFAPTQLGTSTGSIRVDFFNRSSSVNLSGVGVRAVLSYELISGATARPFAANETLTLPETKVGEKTSLTVRVRNTGNADGTITNIRSTGTEFPLSDVPFTPLTIPVGSTISFTVQFVPTLPGPVTGRLRVDDAFFNLSGVGLGATLAYAVTVGSASSTLAANGTAVFPPTQVGASFSARFQVNNTGNSAAFVSSISLTGTVYTLTESPVLPARVGGGESIFFNVVFTPVALGTATGTLRVDNVTFNLSAVGSDPAPLPAVSFAGPGATAEAAQQIAVRLSLASSYPVALTGKLTLSFASDAFADDPAIQFASGGRTVNFTINANSSRAVFGQDATEVRLQTGTVAGVITLSATFATEAGGINLTPAPAPATTMTVRPAAPRIRSVQIAARTTSGFTVLVTGFATSRSVTQLGFQFTQTSDPNNPNLRLETTSLTLNVDGSFGAWYQSAASIPFGSLFTAAVTFTVRGDIEAIQSVGVTATSALGTSNAASANLR